ncbi:hypothetical protein [Dokdonella sp.]|uniref:hypothetical protein n=1 Tax=Dokdonella sp. TaxID=2291710 RepID=UPI003529CAD3
MRNVFLFLTLSLMFASPLSAKKAEEKAVVADTPEKFEVLVLAVREEMAPGKRYEFLDRRNRETVNHQLDLMQQMLIEAGSVSAMDQETKVKLFSMQEEVNGILARNADDRLVCTHVAPVGSHIPKTTCHTVREIAANRAEGRRQSQELVNEALATEAIRNNGL